MNVTTFAPHTGSRPVAIELAQVQSGPEIEAAADAPMTATDLAELLSAFNDVTARLQSTHESLQCEVSRLREELREANEQLQRSRRLAALGEMAAGIAHEVRNPLGSIRLYARMLEQDLTDRPEERQIAGKIASAVKGLDAVVGDVLAFSRELRIRPEPAEGPQLLTRALEACWTLERAESGIRVVVAGSQASRDDLVHCDTNLLHQALVNIIRNALEAMGEAMPLRGGHELRLQCGPSADGQEFTFRIIDTGPGVNRECLDRMFNPFFTTRATGTGLGLAIVHRIVDAHRGRIVVTDRGEEQAGQRGTIFDLMLPRTGDGSSSDSKQPTVNPGNEVRLKQERADEQRSGRR